MAAKFPSDDVPLKPRKGHDMTWSCDEHGEPIKFYCKEHKIPVCHPCATKDHQKPCHLDSIGDVILKMVSELEEKLLELEEMMQVSRKLDSEIQSSSTFMRNHLDTVNEGVNIAFNHKIKAVRDKEREEILLINEEADNQIRILNYRIQIINEERESKIRSSREKSEKKQQSLEDTQVQLLADTKNTGATVGKKIEDLKCKNQHHIDTMDNIGSKIKRIRQDDKALVNEARQIITSLDGSGSEKVHQDLLDALGHLKLEVQRVKFDDGGPVGDDYARIHGYMGKWEILKSIDFSLPAFHPWVCGLISNDEVCVSDNSNNFYITNISNGHTHNVITEEGRITSCVPVDGNLIVCGKWNGCITLYDRQWKLVREITLPTNEPVFVDVDKDGKIVAAELQQPNIYVINPADGQIVNTITMQGKTVSGRVQAFSAGDIIVQTEESEFTVISRSGEEKSVIRHHHHHVREEDWDWSSYYADKLTNTLYITSCYWQDMHRIRIVDQVSCDDDHQVRRIIEYKNADFKRKRSPSVVTPSGNVIAFNGKSFLVYKNNFQT